MHIRARVMQTATSGVLAATTMCMYVMLSLAVEILQFVSRANVLPLGLFAPAMVQTSMLHASCEMM